MAAFDYRLAEEIRDTFRRHRVRYLFIGKSGAIPPRQLGSVSVRVPFGRRRAHAGEEVGAGIALHQPIADVGQTLRVGDGRQQLRQAFGGGQSETRRRHSAQQRSFAIKPLLDPLLKPLFESLLDPC